MARVYNFSAGPAVLPEEVLQEAADEMLDYRGTGMSVMEMSHRSKAYDTIIKEAEADLRELMNIPDNYKVLFLQGGASQQFAMIPMNLMKNRVADYIVTGQWRRRHIRRLPCTARQIRSLLLRIRPSLIFPIAPICPSARMPITCTYARIIPSTVRNSRPCPIPRVSPWLQMYPVAFYPSR